MHVGKVPSRYGQEPRESWRDRGKVLVICWGDLVAIVGTSWQNPDKIQAGSYCARAKILARSLPDLSAIAARCCQNPDVILIRVRTREYPGVIYLGVISYR